MKKVTYLLLVMFAVVLMGTSCEEDPIVPKTNDGLITLAELDGQWYFESYTYDNIDWHCGSDITLGYDNINGDFVNWYFDTDEMVAIKYPSCESGFEHDYDFSKDGNTIKIYNYTFTVISYKNNILRLRLDATPFNYDYLGGILTLDRS